MANNKIKGGGGAGQVRKIPRVRGGAHQTCARTCKGEILHQLVGQWAIDIHASHAIGVKGFLT